VNRRRAQRLCPARCAQAGERGGARTNLLLGVVFLLCIAAVGYWFYTASKRPQTGTTNDATNPPAIQLSDPTRAALGRLDAPLEIRFYSILDPASVPASVSAFSGRVDQLLSA
jgi:zona occludens toxin (predicted ATPase)